MIFNRFTKIINYKDKTKFIAIIAGNDNFYTFVLYIIIKLCKINSEEQGLHS